MDHLTHRSNHTLFDRSPITGCDGTDCQLDQPCDSCTDTDQCPDCRLHTYRHLNALLGPAKALFPETPEEEIAAAQNREVSVRYRDQLWSEELAPKTDSSPCVGGEVWFVDPETGEVI